MWSLIAEIFLIFSDILVLAMLAALAIPIIPGTLWVPALLLLSCEPPWINEPILTLLLTYKKPIPLGPWNLCPLALNISIFISCTLIGICANACTASVWNITPLECAIAPSSLIGSTVPISLLANIMLASIVVSLIAASNSIGSTFPYSSTSRYVTSYPCFSSHSQVWRIAWCSILVVIMWLPFDLNASAAAFNAQLSDSLPPPVKYISLGLAAPRIEAIVSLASSISFLVFCAKLYTLDGLAYDSVK